MTPAEKAKMVCEIAGSDFREAVEAHLLNGYVFSTPTAFLMGRPVPRSVDVFEPWEVWPPEECDAWFVWAGVGDATELLRMMPFDLPWIGWMRCGRRWDDVHWLPTETLRKKLRGV